MSKMRLLNSPGSQLQFRASCHLLRHTEACSGSQMACSKLISGAETGWAICLYGASGLRTDFEESRVG